MKVTVDRKCSHKRCKRRMHLECDGLRSVDRAELAKVALEQGWKWHDNGDLFCPEH